MKIFLYSSSEYTFLLFLTSSAYVRSIPFLSFIVPIFRWNFPLVTLIFLKKSLVFPILLFSSIPLHWSLRKAFLSLLALLQNSAFWWVYLSFSPLPLVSLLFSAVCKASSDNHFAFLHFLFLGQFHPSIFAFNSQWSSLREALLSPRGDQGRNCSLRPHLCPVCLQGNDWDSFGVCQTKGSSISLLQG